MNKEMKLGLAGLGIILMGACLRAPITAVGTLVSMISAQLQLNATAAGFITTIPLLCFAFCSPFVSGIGKRLGFGRMIVSGLVLEVIGIVLRSFAGTWGLFFGTVLMGVGIAIGNVLTPGVIKMKFPNRVGVLTGFYAVAMALSSGIAAAISAPIAQTSAGWQGSLFLWIVLLAIAVVVWKTLQKSVDEGSIVSKKESMEAEHVDGTESTGDMAKGRVKVKAPRSIYKSSMAWWVALLMGSQALVYYAFVAWLPTILLSKGMTPVTAGYYATFNQLFGLPMSFIVPIIAGKLKDQRALGVGTGILYIFALSMLLNANSKPMLLVTLGIAGICAGSANSIVTAMWSLRAANANQASDLAGMSQFMGYILAAIGPTLIGCVYDVTATWSLPIGILILSILLFTVSGYMAGRNRPLFVEND